MLKNSVKSILLILLEELGETSLAIIDEAFLNPRYTFTRPTRALLGLPVYNTLRQNELRKNSFSINLYRLKKEGLAVNSGSKKFARWSLTKRGTSLAADLVQSAFKNKLPAKDNKLRIVCFDIPEKERWKRDRLRSLLVASDYFLLQQSLWIGKRPLTKIVLDAIYNLKLIHYVHIFEISQKGTLREFDF